MADLLAASGYKIPRLRRGQEVTGKIVSISHHEIVIDVGAKSEGIVAAKELSSVKDLISKFKAGDQIEAVVISPENDAGQVVLSLRKLSGEKRWQELEEKQKTGEEIEVHAVEANRGGLICDYFGLRGFLPASQLSGGASQSSKLEGLLGKNIQASILEVDRTTARLILSQKPKDKDIEAILRALANVQIGEKLKGVVTAVLPFGIFVEVEPSKLEGLVHISEISWEKIDNPAKFFKVGDKIEVMAIAKDETSGRLNLSVKQLSVDPFTAVSSKYAKDEAVTGTVARTTPYGIFVILEAGVEGLIHISKLPPDQNYQTGQKIVCTVESIDASARRIALIPIVKAKPILYR